MMLLEDEVTLEMEKRFQRGYKERTARIWRLIGYLGAKVKKKEMKMCL